MLTSPTQVSSLRMSLVHVGYLLISTLISVSVHEFGHAIAAARLIFFPMFFFGNFAFAFFKDEGYYDR